MEGPAQGRAWAEGIGLEEARLARRGCGDSES